MAYVYNLSNVIPKEKMFDSAFLENKKINRKEITGANGTTYNIYRYEKMCLTHDAADTIGLFRSVVFNKERMVAFSPPKSHNLTHFVRNNVDFNQLTTQEFVEGTMINLFYDNNEWELATKGTVGGNSAFFKDDEKITFRRMFLDSMNEYGLEFTMLNKNHCYSFVVQHPRNRIVSLVTKPTLYLIDVYEINNDDYSITSVKASDEIYNCVKVPKTYQVSEFDEVQQHFASMNTPYDIVGIIIKNNNGERTKIRNPVYEKVKHLRGNSPKLQFQYFALRKTGKVREFLKYYPEHRTDFTKFRDDIHKYTNALHSNYISCYVRKEKPLIEFPKEYRGNMFKLHEKYIDYLREDGEKVTRQFVIAFVNDLHPAQLMYVINQPLRQQNVDNKKQIVESESTNEKEDKITES
tara:strand:- start:9 stop:1232 length:1224 start_codon:yes stop_codon:yes gene_type:complete